MSLFGKQKDDDTSARGPGSAAASGAVLPPQQRGRGRRTQEGSSDMATIGKSIAIRGDLTGNEDLVIEGTVEGKVELPDNQLTIGANGNVKAEIHAKTVVVIGRVAGNVHGSERVELQATGVVEGDVSAPRLIVSEGAVFNGAIKMGASTGKAPGHAPPAPGAPKAG